MPSVPLSRTGESSCPRTAILRPSSDVHSRRIDFGLSYVDSSVAWRFPIAVSVRIAQNTATSDAEVSPFVSQFQIVFAIMLVYGVWFLPESPRWLMHEGRHVDAQRVVAAVLERKDRHLILGKMSTVAWICQYLPRTWLLQRMWDAVAGVPKPKTE